MEAWQLILTIFGVTGIVVGGVVKIFTVQAVTPTQKQVKESSGPKFLPSASQSSVHDVDKRLARVEERLNGIDREIRDLKREQEKNDQKTSKLSELIIEWIREGRKR